MSALSSSPDDFRRLFLQDTPFLDVRAEVEFEKAAFPSSRNYPILNTDEREQVGTCYKQQGREAATKLGHELVSGELKQQRIEAWCEFAQNTPNAHMYCWRGGMRSNLAQQWMQQAGVEIPLIPGGYKALRAVLLDELEIAAGKPMVIIGGKTGAAKTPMINQLATGIDLEGYAHHRGSSFGRRVIEPPCQASFENVLAIALLKARDKHPQQVFFVEDESRNVGPLQVPPSFFNAMTEAPIVVIEMPLEYRVQRILQEYVVDMRAEHLAADPVEGYENYREYLRASLYRVRKRLGMERYAELDTLMATALDQQQDTGQIDAHEAWIVPLLEKYYDPMYEYQLGEKKHRVLFSGNYDEVLQWAQEYKS